MKELTPKQIVEELDKYIIGQERAKRAVAIALRNRWRRQQLPPEIREEVLPKNILMIGPTGVGKTEIARRLAKLAKAPFIKVEASKFTEVGYVGRDVESIIRDLTRVAVRMVKEEREKAVRKRAEELAKERVLDLLVPPPYKKGGYIPHETADHYRRTREKMREMLEAGLLDDREVEVEVEDKSAAPMIEVIPITGMEDIDASLKDMLGSLFPKKMKRKAFKMALTARFREGRIKVVDRFDLPEIKTKRMVEILRNLELLDGEKEEPKILILTKGKDKWMHSSLVFLVGVSQP